MSFCVETFIYLSHLMNLVLHRYFFLRKCFDPDVTIPGLAWRSRVDLQTNRSRLLDAGFCFGVIDCLIPVDAQSDSIAFGSNLVVVPIIAFEMFVELLRIRARQHFFAARFIIE